jgi:hypothetical protein
MIGLYSSQSSLRRNIQQLLDAPIDIDMNEVMTTASLSHDFDSIDDLIERGVEFAETNLKLIMSSVKFDCVDRLLVMMGKVHDDYILDIFCVDTSPRDEYDYQHDALDCNRLEDDVGLKLIERYNALPKFNMYGPHIMRSMCWNMNERCIRRLIELSINIQSEDICCLFDYCLENLDRGCDMIQRFKFPFSLIPRCKEDLRYLIQETIDDILHGYTARATADEVKDDLTAICGAHYMEISNFEY